MTVTLTPTPLAGWYADPTVASQLRYWDGTTWTAHTAPATVSAPAEPLAGPAPSTSSRTASEYALVRRLSEYTRWSGVAWIALGSLQIISLFGIVAGVWNFYAGLSRLRLAGSIDRREPEVPAAVRGVAGLVVIGIVNLLLGGVVGIVLVAVDLFVRDKVLTNEGLFTDHAAVLETQPAPRAPRTWQQPQVL